MKLRKERHYKSCPIMHIHQFTSVQFSSSVASDSLWPHESQHARPPCPSPIPGVHSDSHPSSQWCHPAISSSVIPFSSCPQSLPASESFLMSQLFTWGGQSTGVSALASSFQRTPRADLLQNGLVLGIGSRKSCQIRWCSRSLRLFKEMLENLGDDLGIMWGNIPDNPWGPLQFWRSVIAINNSMIKLLFCHF